MPPPPTPSPTRQCLMLMCVCVVFEVNDIGGYLEWLGDTTQSHQAIGKHDQVATPASPQTMAIHMVITSPGLDLINLFTIIHGFPHYPEPIFHLMTSPTSVVGCLAILSVLGFLLIVAGKDRRHLSRSGFRRHAGRWVYCTFSCCEPAKGTPQYVVWIYRMTFHI